MKTRDWLQGLVERGLLTAEQAAEARGAERPGARAAAFDTTPTLAGAPEGLRLTACAACRTAFPTPGGDAARPPACPLCGGATASYAVGAPILPAAAEAGEAAFGRYRLDRELGRGGMGVVYEAWDSVLQRRVALKTLATAERDLDARAVDQLLDEARAAARLRHPHIVEVYDVGAAQGRHYFTMELLGGGNFESELAGGGVPDAAAIRGRLEALLRVAEALGHAHAGGLIHRDVKPSNILRDRAGRVVLTDFGLARAAGADAGAVSGTARYMPPEQERGDAALGPPVDVYALGVVLHRAVAGDFPRPGETPSGRNPAVPAGLDGIVRRCLEPDAAARFPDAAALAFALARHLDGLPAAPLPGEAPRGPAEALRLLERARPVLDLARHYLYSRDANDAEIVRRVGEARVHIERALALAPDLAPAHDLLGRAWDIQGWDDLAEACWRNALRLDPEFAPASFHLGHLLLEKAFLARLITLASNPEARRARAEALAHEAEERLEAALVSGAGFEWGLHRRLAAAMKAYAHMETAEAARLCRAALEEFPAGQGREELLWLLGVSLSGAEAHAYLDQALALRPRYPLALHCRAMSHRRGGRPAAALADCEEALRVKPRFAEAWVSRGVALLDLGRLAESIASQDRAIELAPEEPLAWQNRGAAKFNLGDLRGAEADFTRAIELSPHYPIALSNRAQARMAREDLEGARADIEAAVREAPRRPIYHAHLAEVRLELGDVAGAAAAVEEAFRLGADVWVAWRARGTVRLRQGNVEGARADGEEMTRRAPDDPDAWLARGRILQRTGDRPGAIAAYGAVLRLAPEGWFRRAEIERALAELRPPAGA